LMSPFSLVLKSQDNGIWNRWIRGENIQRLKVKRRDMQFSCSVQYSVLRILAPRLCGVFVTRWSCGYGVQQCISADAGRLAITYGGSKVYLWTLE
jgi:hypothetical protein